MKILSIIVLFITLVQPVSAQDPNDMYFGFTDEETYVMTFYNDGWNEVGGAETEFQDEAGINVYGRILGTDSYEEASEDFEVYSFEGFNAFTFEVEQDGKSGFMLVIPHGDVIYWVHVFGDFESPTHFNEELDNWLVDMVTSENKRELPEGFRELDRDSNCENNNDLHPFCPLEGPFS